MSVLETAAAAAPPVQHLHQNLKRKRATASPTPPTPQSLTRQNSGTISPTPRNKRSKSISNGVSLAKVNMLANARPVAWIEQTTLKALEEHKVGKDGLYQNLKRKFDVSKPARLDELDSEDGPPSNDELRKWVVALTTHSHVMGRESGGLLAAMLNCKWLERDNAFLADFQRFLATLLSAHGGYLPIVLQWLIGKFANVPLQLSEFHGVLPVSRDTVFDRIHETIRLIMALIPASLGIITSSISTTFPFSLSDARSYTDYVKNLFRLIAYDNTLEPMVLGIIMEHLVGIDVHVGIELDELDEEDVSGLMEQVREECLALDSNIDTSDEEENLDDLNNDGEAALKNTISALVKLDVVLDLLFKHFNSIVESDTQDEASRKLSQLVSMFTSKILVTYNSRHCQYLIFRFAQLNPPVFETFMEELLLVAFDNNRAIPIRCSAITYLASFAARGVQLNSEVVQRIFMVFSTELSRLRGNYEANQVRHPDPDRFRLFYTIFQACMYLFCFRWKMFLSNPEILADGHVDDYSELRFQAPVKATFTSTIHSRTNPLKVCSPVIVNQFAYVCSTLKFLFIQDLIEQNKRVRLTRVIASVDSVARDSTLMNKCTEQSLQLEAQYPFEPFSLPRSRMWVDGLFAEFEDPGEGNDDDEEDDDDDEQDEEDDENDD